jgi:hypothetical protein
MLKFVPHEPLPCLIPSGEMYRLFASVMKYRHEVTFASSYCLFAEEGLRRLQKELM